jgi:hypothetical protein
MVYKPTSEDFMSWHAGSPLRATHLDPAGHVYIRVNLTGVTSDFQGCKRPTTAADTLSTRYHGLLIQVRARLVW